MTTHSDTSTSIPDYASADMGYLCTRIKVMSTFLFLPEDWEALQSLSKPSDLFENLLGSDYATELQAEVLETDDLAAFDQRLERTFARRLSRAQGLVRQGAREYQFLVTMNGDLQQVRALVRGCLQGKDPSLVLSTSPAAGVITPERFERAGKVRDLHALVSLLAQWHPPLADHIGATLASTADTGPSLLELELALDRFPCRYMQACAAKTRSRDDAAILRELCALYVDRSLLRTALRHLGRHLPHDKVKSLFMEGGRLPLSDFRSIMSADDIDQVFTRLPRGPLLRALEKGMLYFVQERRPSIFERFVDEQCLTVMKRMARRHPVSIATPLHYLSRAHNELINLRALLRGMVFHLPRGAVQEKLVYA